MQNLLLVREDPAPDGTAGVLTGMDFAFETLERPWANNEHGISCIPAGKYDLQWAFSQKFFDIFPDIVQYGYPYERGFCYHVLNVPNRTGILLHNANRALQLEGCLALGLHAGVMPEPSTGKAVKAVLQSKDAIRRFHLLMKGEPALLEVQWRMFTENSND